ncbi:hypothetical protein SUDANB58_00090 [Streptomyces sp. enrichment culture]
MRTRGEALVAAARAGDAGAARRRADFFVLGHHVDEGIPYRERAVAAGDAFSHHTLARYRKIRGDRAAEALRRAVAERHPGCAYGLGVRCRRQRRYEEAVEPLRAAAARWGGDVRARCNRDDPAVLARMAGPVRELAEAEAAPAAGRPWTCWESRHPLWP